MNKTYKLLLLLALTLLTAPTSQAAPKRADGVGGCWGQREFDTLRLVYVYRYYCPNSAGGNCLNDISNCHLDAYCYDLEGSNPGGGFVYANCYNTASVHNSPSPGTGTLSPLWTSYPPAAAPGASSLVPSATLDGIWENWKPFVPGANCAVNREQCKIAEMCDEVQYQGGIPVSGNCTAIANPTGSMILTPIKINL